MTDTGGSQRHLAALHLALDALEGELERIGRWGEHLAAVLGAGGRLLTAGNGGSAAEAQHLSGELVGRFRDERRPLSAIALHADTSALTAVANDYGAAEAFARGVRAHGRPGDVLLAITTSGRSPNIVSAAEAARAGGLTVWGLCGPDARDLGPLCDDLVRAPGGDTATVQEVHLVAIHLLCAELDRALDATAARTPETVP